jgi:hypothetical protein
MSEFAGAVRVKGCKLEEKCFYGPETVDSKLDRS